MAFYILHSNNYESQLFLNKWANYLMLRLDSRIINFSKYTLNNGTSRYILEYNYSKPNIN